MRHLAALLALPIVTAPAAGDAAARAVLDRAIKAHGGAEALKKAAAFTSSAKGTRAVAGRDVAYVRKLDVSLPGRMRQDITLGRVATTIRLDRGKATQSDGGQAVALRGERVRELQAEADVLWLATLVPLREEGVVLSAARAATVDGEEAVGVKVARKGQADVTLYFSKKTGLLVRVARRGTMAGREVEMEWTFGGHKDIGGVKVPTREVQAVGGKKVAELTVGEWALAEGAKR